MNQISLCIPASDLYFLKGPHFVSFEAILNKFAERGKIVRYSCRAILTVWARLVEREPFEMIGVKHGQDPFQVLAGERLS